jgi:isoquinoline 1-oxidoreductase beta subunit
VRRVVCAVDCGTVVNSDTVAAQVPSAIIFGITAAMYGEVSLKSGRVEPARAQQGVARQELPLVG